VLRYWLVSTEHLLHEDWIPYRVSLLGNYGTDLTLKREINRFLMAEDPYGTVAFVRYGLQRGELHREMDQEMMVSILDWDDGTLPGRAAHEELDPGLFRRQGDPQEKKDARVTQFLDVLKEGDRSMSGKESIQGIVARYDDKAALPEASTIPGPGTLTRGLRNSRRRRSSARPGRWWVGWSRWNERGSS
jgi:hypothetical protein